MIGHSDVVARRRWQLGDVFTIPCGDQVGLAQYEATGLHWRTEGDWVRVLPTLFDSVPSDVCSEFDGRRGWLEHGFLGNWTSFKDMIWLTHCAAPARAGDIACKSPPALLEDGRVVQPWVVFNGTGERWYEVLPEEFDDLPDMGLRDGRSLHSRLASGWLPRDDVAEFGRSCRLSDADWAFLGETRQLAVEGEPGSRTATPT